MAIEKSDINALATIVDRAVGASQGESTELASAILHALPIPNEQGAGHTSFVERVRKILEKR